MPKIRKRVKEVSNNDYDNPQYKSKSGSLTKNYKSLLDSEDFQQGTIIKQNESVNKSFQEIDEFYNDNNTVEFKIGNETLNANLRLNQKLVEKLNSEDNKIFHTPNTFNEIENNTLTNTISGTLKSSYYDDVFYKNNIIIENTPYNENATDTIFNISNDAFKTTSSFISSVEENYKLSNQTSIEIELDFSETGDAFLQNNKIYCSKADNNGNLSDISESILFNDTNKQFETFNTPVAYFDFKNKRWDYILNNTTSFEAYPPVTNDIASSTKKKEYSNLISSSNIAFSPGFNLNENIFNVSTPCFNAKFPVGNQWYGEENNLLELSNYISKDFIVEKVIFECDEVESIGNKIDYTYYTASSSNPFNEYFYSNSNDISYVSNAFNFFILKQSNDINPDSFFEGSGFISSSKYRNDIYFSSLDNNQSLDSLLNDKDTIVKDYKGQLEIYRGINVNQGKSYLLNKSIEQRTSTSRPSKRELLTSSCFLIYNSKNDYISNLLNNNNHIDNTFNCEQDDINKTFFNFKLESDFKTYNKDNIHNIHVIGEGFGFNSGNYTNDTLVYFYSNNYFGGKDLQGNLISNFIINENNSINNSYIHLESTSNTKINTLKETSFKSPVILKPEDKLIFGVNAYTNGNILPYMFILKNKAKVTLIGRHILDNKKIDTKLSQSQETSKSIRKVIDRQISNQYNIVSIDEINGTYLDKVYEDEDIYNINSSNILDRNSIGKLSSKLHGTFSNTVNLYSKEEVLYDSLVPSIFDYIKDFTFDDILLSNNTITLNYNTTGDPPNTNQWLNSYPYQNEFSSLYDKRNSKIFNQIKEIDRFIVDIDESNHTSPYLFYSSLYQYVNLVQDTDKFLSFGNDSIKDFVYDSLNNKNKYIVYKNLRGYIETNNNSVENNLSYLSQGQSNGIEIPTNIFADVLVWKNSLIQGSEPSCYIKDFYYAAIIRLRGNIFGVEPSLTLDTNNYIFPKDEDNLDPSLSFNRKYRIAFYNPEVSSNSEISYSYHNQTSKKHLPYKVLVRSVFNTAEFNFLNTNINPNTVPYSWDRTLDNTLNYNPNSFLYLEKERTITIRRIETTESSIPSNFDFEPESLTSDYQKDAANDSGKVNQFEGNKDITISDYGNETDTVNKINSLFFGFSNKLGTCYKRHPIERLDGWKYGILSGVRSYVKHNFDWKKFGQFADRVNGSKNYAIFIEDGSVRYPIEKTFYDQNFYPIDTDTASSSILSAMNTYNKDHYSRHVTPFIES